MNMFANRRFGPAELWMSVLVAVVLAFLVAFLLGAASFGAFVVSLIFLLAFAPSRYDPLIRCRKWLETIRA